MCARASVFVGFNRRYRSSLCVAKVVFFEHPFPHLLMFCIQCTDTAADTVGVLLATLEPTQNSSFIALRGLLIDFLLCRLLQSIQHG